MITEAKSVEQIDEELRRLRRWTVGAVVVLVVGLAGMTVLPMASEYSWQTMTEHLVGGIVVSIVLFVIGTGIFQYSVRKSRRLTTQKSIIAARAMRQHVYRPIVAPPFMAFQHMQYLAQARQASSSQLSDKLRQLEHAHAQGLLSEEEFAKQRAALLLPDDLGVVVLKCTSCGAQLRPQAGQTSVVCGYCNSTNHLVRS